MPINVVKIKGKEYEIKPPEKGAFMIETHPDFIKLNCLMLCAGRRGSGKTVAIANFIAQAKRHNYYDRVKLITPTHESNREIWDIAGIEDQDVHLPTKNVLTDMIKFIEDEKLKWDIFLAKKAQYHSYTNEMRHKPLASFTPEKLIYYLDNKFFSEPPSWEYPVEQPPRICVILDDAMGTDLLKPSAGLTRFTIAHRHWGSGLGCSVIMCVQSYCARESIARPIREQCTHLMLFRLKDENQRKKILTEIGSEIPLEKFNELYDYCTKEPFNFLFIDFAPKSPDKIFRHNFNEYLT